ncbi:hypothetical protein BC829DRAFT_432348 [Chytridium lagenaria]|nr:hypothetical protein BC829DRAFT_432348 [Chytridium lagenaria]
MVGVFRTVSVVFLSISRTTSGSVSVVDMVKSVCLFGIVFPILRYISSQLARRGLKLYSTKEPTNIEEERTLNYNTFRFIVCQDMVWSSLSNLLLAEIRDNTTFTIAVICSHIVIFASRIFSAATFRRLQLERKGKTTPILSETYHQVQKHVIMNVTDVQKTKPSLMRLTEDSPPDYKKKSLHRITVRFHKRG